MRGFGIDATVDPEVAGAVAVRAEEHGFRSFWVNGSPPEGALSILERVAPLTDFDLGVGVFPLTRISASELVTEVSRRSLPQDRLWLGVGSSRSPGALTEVRQAVEMLRRDLEVKVVTAAVGPKMHDLAAEIADAVIFTWWVKPEVERSRNLLEAAATGRSPTVVSYIRCALLPQAAQAIAERAAMYDALPRYQDVFARNGVTAADTVVTGGSRAELLPGIDDEESVVDVPVIRAIPSEDTVEALSDLVVACAP